MRCALQLPPSPPYARAAPACSALVAGQARGKAGVPLQTLCLYNLLDIAAALGLALIVNVAVLLVAAATFHQAGERCWLAAAAPAVRARVRCGAQTHGVRALQGRSRPAFGCAAVQALWCRRSRMLMT